MDTFGANHSVDTDENTEAPGKLKYEIKLI
jgi:hypothetical protein